MLTDKVNLSKQLVLFCLGWLKNTFIQIVRIILFLELRKPTKKKEKPNLRLQFKYELLTPSSLREVKNKILGFHIFQKVSFVSTAIPKTPKT